MDFAEVERAGCELALAEYAPKKDFDAIRLAKAKFSFALKNYIGSVIEAGVEAKFEEWKKQERGF